MPQIRLAVEELQRKRIPDPAGFARDVVHVRLFTRLTVKMEPAPRVAIVDTGAPVSLFPVGAWEQLPGLDGSPGPHAVIPEHRDAPLDRLPLYTVVGCTYRAKHGWLDITPVDVVDDTARLAPCRVFAALFTARVVSRDVPAPRAEDDKRLKHIVMGVGAGILDGRYLIVSPHPDAARRAAWLQDENPINPMETAAVGRSSSRIPPLL